MICAVFIYLSMSGEEDQLGHAGGLDNELDDDSFPSREIHPVIRELLVAYVL